MLIDLFYFYFIYISIIHPFQSYNRLTTIHTTITERKKERKKKNYISRTNHDQVSDSSEQPIQSGQRVTERQRMIMSWLWQIPNLEYSTPVSLSSRTGSSDILGQQRLRPISSEQNKKRRSKGKKQNETSNQWCRLVIKQPLHKP